MSIVGTGLSPCLCLFALSFFSHPQIHLLSHLTDTSTSNLLFGELSFSLHINIVVETARRGARRGEASGGASARCRWVGQGSVRGECRPRGMRRKDGLNVIVHNALDVTIS